MSDGRKGILRPLTGRKKGKAWNNTREKYQPVKTRQNLAETDRRSYYNKEEERLEEFLDGKDAFYNGNESDDNDNDDQINGVNLRIQSEYRKRRTRKNFIFGYFSRSGSEGFVNNCCKIVSPILLLALISKSAVQKHCSSTLLLVKNVSHGFGLELHISKRSHSFFRSTQSMPHFFLYCLK